MAAAAMQMRRIQYNAGDAQLEGLFCCQDDNNSKVSNGTRVRFSSVAEPASYTITRVSVCARRATMYDLDTRDVCNLRAWQTCAACVQYTKEPLGTEKHHTADVQPAVLIAHTAIGHQEPFLEETVRAIAQAGYAAFALDLFGAGHAVFGDEKTRYNQELKSDRALIAQRALAALQVVQAQEQVDAQRVAAIGFCLGGKCVLDLMRSAPDDGALRAVVTYHGILDAWPYPEVREVPRARVLAFHGYKDPCTSDDMLLSFCDEMEERGVDYEVRVLGPDVLHAFMRPDKTSNEDAASGLQYNAIVAKRAWDTTMALLSDVL